MHNNIFTLISISVDLISLRNQIQSGKKVFSQPPIVQVLPLQMMTEVCNFRQEITL